MMCQLICFFFRFLVKITGRLWTGIFLISARRWSSWKIFSIRRTSSSIESPHLTTECLAKRREDLQHQQCWIKRLFVKYRRYILTIYISKVVCKNSISASSRIALYWIFSTPSNKLFIDMVTSLERSLLKSPIYYPELYREYLYLPPTQLLGWKPIWKNHVQICASCRKFDFECELSVEWNASFVGFRVVYGRIVHFPLSFIEKSAYVHCHIIKKIFLQHRSRFVSVSCQMELSNEIPS